MTAPPGPPAGRPRAVRLLFGYEQGRARLLSQQVVDATPPPSAPLDGGDDPGRTGFWAEVRAAGGRREYRQLLSDPTGEHVEVFAPPPGRAVVRAPAPGRRVVFSVLAPVTERSAEVVLISRAAVLGPGVRGAPGGPGRVGTPGVAGRGVGDRQPPAPVARELARFALELDGTEEA